MVATGKVAGAVGAIARNSPAIVRHWRRALRRVTHGKLNIPIFGSGGVGKSTAAKVLAGMPVDAAYEEYSESLWPERVELQGDIPGRLLVAPGQLGRVNRHWPENFNPVCRARHIGKRKIWPRWC